MKVCVLALMLACPTPLFAQSAANAPASNMPAPNVPVMTPAMSIPLGTRVGTTFSGYDDGGRRDPFASLVMPKRAAGSPDGRPKPGLAGLALADVLVKGIVNNGDTMLAILEAPGKQSYVARVKDRLADASIQSIVRDGVVFAEQAGGGASLPVRKALRTGEEVR